MLFQLKRREHLLPPVLKQHMTPLSSLQCEQVRFQGWRELKMQVLGTAPHFKFQGSILLISADPHSHSHTSIYEGR